jgi:hypothetical protein
MSQDPCSERVVQVRAALEELESIHANQRSMAGAGGSASVQGSDFGSSYYASVGRLEAAKRGYRAAIRALTECRTENPALSPD